MGIDIANAFTIRGGSPLLKIAGASDILTIDATGRTFYPNQIGFIAGLSTDPGWVALTPDAWNIQNWFDNTTYNKGGGFSAGRFTAPVAGAYLLHWTGYHYKPTALQGHYVHPQFWVNGGGVPTSYRMRGHFTPSGYAFHSEIVDIYYLNAGDYVDVNVYSGAAGTNISLYRYYSMFAGMLVG